MLTSTHSRRRALPAALVVVAAAVPFARPLAAQSSTAPTVVLVTRHAERGTEPAADPSITPAGVRRANALADALADAGVAAVYVTQWRRTRETAGPLAERLKLAVTERPVNAANQATYAADLARELRQSHAGRTVLVVGHSNTVPDIVRALGAPAVGPIADDRYGDLFVVTAAADGGARLVRTRVDALGGSGGPAPNANGAAGAAPNAGAPAPMGAATPAPRPADVASVDAIVAALYASISGPAGQARDWDRLRSLFAPSARMLPLVRRPDGTVAPVVLTPDDYVARSGERLTRDGFTEREVARRAEQFGHLVHVWSTYDGRFTAPGVTAPPVRGINSIQLMNDGARWWVLSLAWEAESEGNRLPAKYLP